MHCRGDAGSAVVRGGLKRVSRLDRPPQIRRHSFRIVMFTKDRRKTDSGTLGPLRSGKTSMVFRRNGKAGAPPGRLPVEAKTPWRAGRGCARESGGPARRSRAAAPRPVTRMGVVVAVPAVAVLIPPRCRRYGTYLPRCRCHMSGGAGGNGFSEKTLARFPGKLSCNEGSS